MTTKTKTKPDTAHESEYERQLRKEEQWLDWDIRDMEMKIAFAESLVTTLTGIRDRMIETRDRVSQYAKVGSVRASWLLPPPPPPRRND